jgi:hypothetical protein
VVLIVLRMRLPRQFSDENRRGLLPLGEQRPVALNGREDAPALPSSTPRSVRLNPSPPRLPTSGTSYQEGSVPVGMIRSALALTRGGSPGSLA